jgi:hypothetical protein
MDRRTNPHAEVGAVVLSHYGGYTDYALEKARGIILSAVKKANADVHYKGRIIAPPRDM